MQTRWPARACAHIVVFLLLSVSVGEGADATVKTVMSDPARYDGQAVILAGTVNALDARVSKRGNAYYTFKLDDGSGRVNVFAFGQPPCPSGSRVAIDGTFRRVKQVSGHTFHDQVDARHVSCR
jgi:DNA polymerase III alpha subunit